MTFPVSLDVRSELRAMREVGMRVPDVAFAWVDANGPAIQDYRDNGMSISEIADHVVQIAAI